MRKLFVLLILLSLCVAAPVAGRKKPVVRPSKPARRPPVVARSIKPKTRPHKVTKPSPARRKPARPATYSGPWTAPTFADSTSEDNVDGEDLDVRRAAVAALGPYRGTVVVTDPQNGRVLSIVNQKLALASGYQPCSTVKLVTTLAALQEELIPQIAPFRLTSQAQSSLTEAIARSTNWYFATLGQKLGFERVLHHARLLGLGEKAGWDIPGEQPGVLPSAAPRDGGVGMMTSFGSGISLTPLELAALVGAVANGGTLHYLQYPRTPAELAELTPRVKRELAIGDWIDDLKLGMRAAVERGTARRAAREAEEPIFGKTGTCTDFGKGAHMGWFGSFNEVGDRKLVVVVMLAGARGVSGPIASGIAGKVYAELARLNYILRASRALRYPNS
jgi:cell division protein FtsI/penicillin-binding protein 2